MQAPSQACRPEPHSTPHLPALQVAVPPDTLGQVLPHAPQLAGSLSRLRQTLPQRWYAVSQVTLQVPLTQAGAPCAVPPHILAHWPQLLGSVLGSTQAPPQFCVASGQFSLQLPPVHTSSALQAWPQAPQLAGSLLVLTQAPAQSAKPALQRV